MLDAVTEDRAPEDDAFVFVDERLQVLEDRRLRLERTGKAVQKTVQPDGAEAGRARRTGMRCRGEEVVESESGRGIDRYAGMALGCLRHRATFRSSGGESALMASSFCRLGRRFWLTIPHARPLRSREQGTRNPLHKPKQAATTGDERQQTATRRSLFAAELLLHLLVPGSEVTAEQLGELFHAVDGHGCPADREVGELRGCLLEDAVDRALNQLERVRCRSADRAATSRKGLGGKLAEASDSDEFFGPSSDVETRGTASFVRPDTRLSEMAICRHFARWIVEVVRLDGCVGGEHARRPRGRAL
jgi:hypothetical protein